MGFTPTRFDHDIWIRKRDDGSGYDYISTYVDDFMITAKEPWGYMKHRQSIIMIKKPAAPDIYLGASYTRTPESDWSESSNLYIKEALAQIQRTQGEKILEEPQTYVKGDHPELDTSPLLNK